MAAGNTFIVEKACPICGESTHVVKTRTRLIIISTDEDFCAHYKDFNPYFYTIWVCEHCGFAADEKHFLGAIPEKYKEKIRAVLSQHPIHFTFSEERSLPEAVASFELAIYFAKLVETPYAHVAGLELELAWVYRLAGDKENERRMEEKAIEDYDKSLMNDRFPVGMLTDTAVIYLIGALYHRIGNIEKSAQYLGHIMSDKDTKIQDRNMYDKARRLWQDIREEQKTAAAKK